MAWNNAPRVELHPEARLLPLPLLLQGLSLLSAPAGELERLLRRLLDGNVLARIEGPAVRRVSFDDDNNDWLENIEAPPSLDAHLRSQLALFEPGVRLSNAWRERVVEMLDRRGYLNVAIDVFARAVGLSALLGEALLHRLQEEVEPPGLFARDLAECLLLQLRRFGEDESDAAQLLREGGAPLVSGERRNLPSRLGWSEARFAQAMTRLRRLDPHPGYAFSPAQPVLPEVELFVAPAPGARLLTDHVPGVAIDDEMRQFLFDPSLRSVYGNLRFVLRALASRFRTKVLVGRSLAARQESFLKGERSAVAPLVLKEIAGDMGCDVSTVHRALRECWALTPRGLLPLAALLSRPLHADPRMSVAELRQRVRELRAEGLSDRAMADRLGLPVRTVNWHRGRG